MTTLYQIKDYLNEAEAQLVLAKAHARNMGLTGTVAELESTISRVDSILFEIELKRISEVSDVK